MSTLYLPMKGIYFEEIRRGEKVYEYREANEYWAKRLLGRSYSEIELTKGYPPKGDTSRRINRPWLGFHKTTITHPHFGPDPVEVYAIRVN
jgi:hypothetical protein